MYDVLIIGAGPAGLALAAALAQAGRQVAGLLPGDLSAPWPNTYGIWCDEIEGLALDHCLAHRWHDTAAFAGGERFDLARDYALFDNARLKQHLLGQCEAGGMAWHRGSATHVDHTAAASRVRTGEGDEIAARLVVDASGHRPVFVQRPFEGAIAYQAAYGLVGTFSTPPVPSNQLVLMDYSDDHLPTADRGGPPTFLYAMDLGNGRYFVEETSLAHVPALGYDLLEQRLRLRLAHHGVEVVQVEHVEHCLFPMNMPLPYRNQPLLGYGAAASMVHPISGYQVGAALRSAPALAAALADALRKPQAGPAQLARTGWHALWPAHAVRTHALYLFGLRSLLRFDTPKLNRFFAAFFALPYPLWTGYLSNTLATREVAQVMLAFFRQAPADVRSLLVQGAGSEGRLLWQALAGQ